MAIELKTLKPNDIDLMRDALSLFKSAFAGYYDYDHQPDDSYLTKFLANPSHYVGVALAGDQLVGAITAYELMKYEQPRSEVFIYDLAVHAEYRRQGIATQLINETRDWGETRGAWVAIIMSDDGEPEPYAVYDRLGKHEVAHLFAMPIPRPKR